MANVIKFLRLTDEAKLPTKAHEDDACFDLYSSDKVIIPPGRTLLVSTGFSIAIPEGHTGLVCSRSGLAAKEGVFVLNAPGVVDAGYRGPLKVVLHNTSDRPYYVERLDRVAQLLLQKVLHCEAVEVQELADDTTRGTTGFGATGR